MQSLFLIFFALILGLYSYEIYKIRKITREMKRIVEAEKEWEVFIKGDSHGVQIKD